MNELLLSSILKELNRIGKMLTILSQDKRESFNEMVNKKYLTTAQRRHMYELFDGNNSYRDIAETVKLSAEGVRKFAVQLEEAGLVEFISAGRTQNPKRTL